MSRETGLEPTSGLELIPATSRVIAHAELKGSAACGFEPLAAIRLGTPQDADTGAGKRFRNCGQFPVSHRRSTPDRTRHMGGNLVIGLSRAAARSLLPEIGANSLP